MTREEPEFLTDIRDFTTLFYVILRRKSSEGLETSVKDVHAYCFCASLLRTQIHMPRHATSCHAMHRARAPSAKRNNDRADGHCYSFDWI